MGLTPLALVGGTPHDTDRYNNWLEGRLAEISPLLVANPVWLDAMMGEVFGHPWLSQTYASLPLQAAAPVRNIWQLHLGATCIRATRL